MKFQFSFREQIIAIVLVGIIILVLFSIFLLKPSLDRLGDLSKKQTEEKTIYLQKKQQLESLKSDKEQVAAVEAKSLKLSKAMPKSADLPSLVLEIQQAAKETNIKLLEVQTEQRPGTGAFSTISLSLNVTGAYFNLGDFFYQLVKMNRKVKINKVEIAVSGEGYPLLNVKLDISAFVYGQLPVSSSGTGASQATTSRQSTQSTK